MSLVGHWRLDGDVTDSVGNNDGSGAPTYVDGKLGQGIDGTGERITVDYANGVKSALSGNQFTLSLWWRQYNNTDYRWSDIVEIDGRRLERGRGDDGNPEADFWCNIGSGNGSNLFNSSVNGVDGTEWFHTVVRRNGDDYEVWINGEVAASGTRTEDINYSGNLEFDHQPSGSEIDDIRLYDHAISEKRIAQLSRAKVLHYKFNKAGTDWNKFGEGYGKINQSDNHITISQTAGGGGNNNVIGVYSSQTVDVGESATYRVKNTEGRHATIAGLSNGAAEAYPHDGGGSAAVSLYSRADNVSANTSFQDEDGNTDSGTPGPQDFRSYRTIRIDRPDNSTVKIYVDGSLETTFNGTFQNPKNVYFAADGYDTPNTIKVDSLSINGTENSLNRGVTDASGQGNDGTLNGPTFSESSKIGSGAYDFGDNNTSDYIISENAPHQSGDPEVTLSVWAKAANTSQEDWTGIVGLDTSQNNNTTFTINTDGYHNGNISLHFWGNSVDGGFNYDTNWHHYVAVNTGNSEQRFYVDGDLIGTGNYSINIPNDKGPLVGGRAVDLEDNTGQFWDGKIDDARLYTTALSASEVQEVYEARASIDSGGTTHAHELEEIVDIGVDTSVESAGLDTGSAYTIFTVNGSDVAGDGRGINVAEVDRQGNLVRWGSFDVYGSPTTETDNLVTFIENSFAKNILLFGEDDHAGNIQPNGVEKIQSLGSKYIHDVSNDGRSSWSFICIKGYGWRAEKFAPSGEGPVTASYTFPDDINIQTTGTISTELDEIGPAAGSLVGWWPLDGDTKDYAGSNNGTNNGASVTSGLGQSAYQFDGSNDSIEIDNGPSFNSVTLTAWLYPTEINNDNYQWFVPNNDEIRSYIDNGTGDILWKVKGGTGGDTIRSTTGLNKDRWYFVAQTYNNSKNNAKIYVDGKLDANGSATSNGINLDRTYIGRDGFENYDSYHGKIQDVRIYDRALSDSEVAQLYAITDPRKDQRMIQTKDGQAITKEQFSELL